MQYSDKFNPHQPHFRITFFPLLCLLGETSYIVMISVLSFHTSIPVENLPKYQFDSVKWRSTFITFPPHRMSTYHVLVLPCNTALLGDQSSLSVPALHAVPSPQPDMPALYRQLLHTHATLFSAHPSLGKL